MLFRNKDSSLINICKSEYKNDILYYKKIMNTFSQTIQMTTTTTTTTQMSQMVNTISQFLYNK
jgi:hypothetical protein